ncbi:MAG: hypothetical protein GC190_21750 [Alphaproteobacteria bacterium]|nr:hypothetical protein [Alphaproteobacteria bacterium]
MGTTIAIVVYYLAAILTMGGALYLWREASTAGVARRLKALTTRHAKAAEDHEQELQQLEAARDDDRRQWVAEFQHAREHIERLHHELNEARSGARERWRAFAEMQQVWHAGSDATEDEAKALLRNHMWVLEPEFRLIGERIEWEVNLPNALSSLYDTYQESDHSVWKEPPDPTLRIDIAAVVSMVGALGTPRTHAGDEALLLVEAKRPGIGVLNEAARDQVLRYAANLRKLAPRELMSRRIECLLIGGRIPDHMNDVVVKWDSEGEAPTIVRFLTWETLLKRAERACELSGPRRGAKPHAAEHQALAAQ